MKQYLLYMLLLLSFPSTAISLEYFQQRVNYTISVRLNDSDHSLSGFETIVYINNSPNQLDYIYFHLWANAYKNNTTAFAKQQIQNANTDFYFADESERGFIDSLDFRVDGIPVKMLFENDIDICRIILNKPLLPGDSIVISTPFYVKIPGSFSRFGHVDQAYQITQWYPKPAVYDHSGWNQMPYLDQGEFYSEFGSYDVSISLPGNYVVAATGNLVTKSEMDWLNAKAADSLLQDGSNSSEEFKTIRYTEDNIHDFAWFADKNYQVKKGEVTLHNGHKVTTWAMFLPSQADYWKDASEYIGDALKFYSQWYGNYPYNNCTAVSGSIEAGGAMEYPTITVVGNASTIKMLENFIMHEVGHNWFYGILGFNERKYPMLDEGINTFSEYRYFRTKYPDLKLHEWLLNNSFLIRLSNIEDVPMSEFYNLAYLIPARAGSDQPMNLNSESFTSINYGSIAYYKSSLVYTYLFQYLGEERFNEIMQKFFMEWKFRHPGPEDLRKAFTDATQEDLSWLDDLMTTRKRVDYAIGRYKDGKVLVKNKGQIASPVQMSYSGPDHLRVSTWYPGFSGKNWLSLGSTEATHLTLFDSIYNPEFNRRNNYLKTRGLFKRIEPLDIRMLQIVEKHAKTLVGFMPVAGWNNYNKTMLGILLYNPLLPNQKFEYQIMPMFGFGNTDLAGMGRAAIHFYPVHGAFQSISFSVGARRFGSEIEKSYNRTNAEILFTLNKVNKRSPVTTSFKLAGVTISEPGVPDMDFGDYYFITLDANVENTNILTPYGINVNLEKADAYLKSSLTFDLAKTFKYASKAIKFRMYAGIVLDKKYPSFYPLRLSGASGMDDYRYENLYLGRYENPFNNNSQHLLSQQFVRNEGGFVSYVPFGYSDKWLVTAGLSAKLPKIHMISVFANAGTYSNAGYDFKVFDEYGTMTDVILMQKIAWETGLMLKIAFLQIYFPVAVSEAIKGFNDLYMDNYFQTIRYSIDFNALNPFRLKNMMIK